MKRYRLRNQFLSTKSKIDRKTDKKQKNLCVSLIRQVKKEFFENLNVRDLTDNKNFGKQLRLFLRTIVKLVQKVLYLKKER